MAVVEANNDIKVLKSKEEAEIERILYELSQEAGGFADSIIEGYNAAIELDILFAKAKLASVSYTHLWLCLEALTRISS